MSRIARFRPHKPANGVEAFLVMAATGGAAVFIMPTLLGYALQSLMTFVANLHAV